jgi:DNA-binding NarL/FixJ family response regulator
MPLRILIVDDFEKFRRYLCSVLEQDPRFQIVGQASDGMEAVQKAAELKPDLVLLDVGLPRLNGVQAARQMRKVAPLAKILFISQEFSFDVVKAALRSGAGALGYIQKLNVARELLPGIEAVLAERYFVRGTVKQKFREAGGSPLRHEIQIYSDDAALVEGFADFTATELGAGKAAIVVATPPHLTGILQGLRSRNVDVERAIETGILLPRDAHEILSKFMVDGRLDPERFFDAVEALVAESTRVIPRVAACGEIAPQLFAAGETLQALRLEQLWDIAAHGFHLDILCGYALKDFERDSEAFRTICAEHSAVHMH